MGEWAEHWWVAHRFELVISGVLFALTLIAALVMACVAWYRRRHQYDGVLIIGQAPKGYRPPKHVDRGVGSIPIGFQVEEARSSPSPETSRVQEQPQRR